MKPSVICLFTAGLLVPLPPAGASEPVPLFDGQSLNAWEGTPGLWRVEDGAITGEIRDGAALGRNEWIWWQGEVHDFELELEYRISGGAAANSGIQIRSQRGEDGHAAGLQCDLDDGREWLGRIYDEHGRALVMERGTRVSIAPDGRRWQDPFAEAKSFQPVAKPEGWNRYRIKASGSHVEVWVNGVFFGALDDHEVKAAEYSGRLAFQLHAGPGPAKIQFRHIMLRGTGRTALPPAAAGTVAKGPEPVLPAGADGKPLNLNFETGTLEGWTVEGDAFAGPPAKGDTVKQRRGDMESRHAGDYWMGGYEPKHTDAGTGTLTSQPFAVTRPWAGFLIGGGSEVPVVRAEIVEADSGRVFHTAAGRGEETMHREIVDMRPLLGKQVFVRLVDRGTGGWQHLNFDDFVFYPEAPAVLEERAGRQAESPVLWHLRANPAAPSPVARPEAQKTVAGMMLTSGFQAELIAAEPEVRQPVAFCMDAKGRLWVLEGHSYPNKQPEGKGRDQITILSDRDGDGVFETRRVFATGLNLASGIEAGFGGVFVGAAPELLFIPDRNGDDQPDGPPEVLLDGWGYQDTHETLNSFTWGPDGWLYGCQGVFTHSEPGRPGTPKEQRPSINAGVWRFHPVRREFEVFASGGSNQWGLDYNENGHFFMTHCRSFFGGGGTTYVIPNGHYWNQANSGYAPFISNAGAGFAPNLKNYLPASALYDSGEGGAGKPGTTAVFGGHSHVGTLIYQGNNWPAAYRGHLFTHNLHGHQMNHQVNVRMRSGYETMHAGADLLFAPDPRYMGVDLQSGPDGAVYAIDWQDQQHCHTPVEEKWDRTNGRIYRISWAAAYQPVKVDLTVQSDGQLANLQRHEDEWHRRHARQLLMERAAQGGVKPEALAVLEELAGHEDAPVALRGLWTLHQCGALAERVLAAAAVHPSDVVRSWAVYLSGAGGGPRLKDGTMEEMAKTDPSAMVRLALASALPKLPAAQRWDIASALAMHGGDDGDRFLPKMIWFGLATVVKENWGRALELAAATPLEIADSIRWYAAQDAAGREALAAALLRQSPEAAARTVQIAAFALRDQTALTPPAGLAAAVQAMGQPRDAATAAAMDELAAVFGDREVLGRMRRVLADAAAPMEERKAAFALLKRTGDREALPVFAGLLDRPEFQAEVIPLLGRSDDPAVAAALLERFGKLPPAGRSAALAALTSRVPLALTLVHAMEDGRFDRKHLTALHLRQMRNLGSSELNARLEKTWGHFNPTSGTARAAIAKFAKLFKEAPLWAYDAGKGQEVFTKTCAACHAFGGGEAKIGPDLGGTWRNGVDYFLENIADPNAVIGEAFQLSIVTRKDGTTVAGAVEKETPAAVTLRTLTETVTVPAAEIKSREKLPQSLMPPGLLEAMSEREVIELLKFLTSER